MSDCTYIVSPGPAITLVSGAPAGAGDKVKADPKDPHVARLVETGRLVETQVKPKRTRTKKESA